MAANCLMHGSRLPAHLPNLRDRLVYHAHKSRALSAKSGERKELTATPEDDVGDSVEEESGDTAQPGDVHDSSTGIEADELTLDVLLVSHYFVSLDILYLFCVTRMNIYLHMQRRS